MAENTYNLSIYAAANWEATGKNYTQVERKKKV